MKYNEDKSQEKTMIPKLLVSNNQTEIQKYIDLQIGKFSVSSFDINKLGKTNSSIKIEEIRELKQKLFLKPFQGEKKAIIIYNAENLTIEAQNACLKILEEPPEDTLILLVTPNENLLLPTIISRCEIVRLKFEAPLLTADCKLLASMDLGEKFALAENLTKKIDKEEKLEDTRKRAENFVKNLAENYMKSDEKIKKENLITLSQTLKNIKSNLNIRLTLENCFINLC